jgi:hypothetical protein
MPMTHTQLSRQEVFDKKGSEIILDIESYPNYFLINIEYIACGSKVWFEGTSDLNRRQLLWMLRNNTVYTFNGNKYDMIMCMVVLAKMYTDEQMYEITQQIIGEKVPKWKLLRELDIIESAFKFNHVDLIELAKGQASLKAYAGRLHAPYMQDLPYHFSTHLTKEQKANVFDYCWNDTNNTKILKEFLQPDLDLRVEMGKSYAADIRSKSDAQIAEVLFARELKWTHGVDVKRPKVEPGYSFKYKVPDNVTFTTPVLQGLLEIIRNSDFKLSACDQVEIPKSIASMKIAIGKGIYRIGLGGLHSSEKWVYYDYDSDHKIIDRDVASYYPRIILNQKLYPKHLTHQFLSIYDSVVERRLEAKAKGDTLTAQSLKIVVNGSFGKFGSVYSFMFSPDLLIQTTISGQLYLLMLIERFHLNGFNVISANTDGVVTRIPTKREDEFNAIINQWERDTGFVTEETVYNSYWARDVNCYLGIKPGGKFKTKGAFAGDAIDKNPSGSIIYKAIGEYISRGTPIVDTVNASSDVREFVFTRAVDGGCVDHEGNKIGEVIRYYRQIGNLRCLRNAESGNKVALTDGCAPLMYMPKGFFPDDVDRSYYVKQADAMLRKWRSKNLQATMDFG